MRRLTKLPALFLAGMATGLALALYIALNLKP